MKWLLLVLSVCLVPAFFFMSGCGGPRVEVAKKKVLDQIDDMLGKIDVQKAEIDAGIKSAKIGVDGVRKAKIKAQVQLEQLDEKSRPFDEKIAQCDETLVKLRDLLKADMSAEIAGKTYSVAEMKDMAGKVIQARKDAETQLNGFKTTRESMRKLVAGLGRKQQEYESAVTNLQAQVGKLDAEMMAAKALKQASAAMGDKDATMASNLSDLEQKIAALSADVKVELQGSTGLSEADSTKTINEVDAFIQNSQKSADPLAEIDRILGKSKK